MESFDSAYENLKEYSLNIDTEERKKNLPAIIKSINEDVKVLEYLLELGNLKNKIILDLGCGACIPSAGIADLSPYVIGVDISRPILKEVGDLVLDHYDVYVHRICGNFARLPFKDDSIDVVLGGGYLHHVSDLDILLKEIKRVLKKDGLLISTNEPIKTISWTSRSYTSECDFPHFSWEWRKAFHKNGFDIKYFGIRPLGKIEPLTMNAVIGFCFEIINNIHLGLVYSFVLAKDGED